MSAENWSKTLTELRPMKYWREFHQVSDFERAQSVTHVLSGG